MGGVRTAAAVILAAIMLDPLSAAFLAQERAQDAALVRYAARVRMNADSGYYAPRSLGVLPPLNPILDLITIPWGKVDSAKAALRESSPRIFLVAKEIGRRRSDFDATDPPPLLNRVHAQMLAALDSLAISYARWDSVTMSCGSSAAVPELENRCTTGAMREFSRSLDAKRVYEESRERARKFLFAAGVPLDSLTPSTGKPK
jgi:hypothetical protein